jgi:hypothetical protein
MLGWGVFAGALAYGILVITGLAPYHGEEITFLMGDAGAYYYTETPYDWTDDPAGSGAFRYAPPFLWLIGPGVFLPWEVFAGLWFALHVVVLIYLGVPWLLAFPPVMDDAVSGNISVFLALVVVLILRHRAVALWAFVAIHQGDSGRRPGLARRTPRMA